VAQVTVQRYAAELGRLPPTCICCGQPAQQMVRHKFYYDPLWLIVFGPVMGWLRYIWATQNLVMFAPVCSRHGWRLGLPTYTGYAFAFSLLIIAPLMIAASQMQSLRGAIGWIWLAVFLYTLGMLALMLIARLITPRLVDFDTGSVTFGSVSLGFKAAITGQALPGQGLRSLGQTNPTLPGQPGANPTHLTSPATNNGPLIALLGVGGGFLVLVVLGFVVLGAVYFNRARREAAFRRQQADAKAFHDQARADAEARHQQNMADLQANRRRAMGGAPTFNSIPSSPAPTNTATTLPTSTSTPPPKPIAPAPPAPPPTTSTVSSAPSVASPSIPDSDPFGIGQQIGPPSNISAGGIPPRPRADLEAKADLPIRGRFDKPDPDVGPDGQVEVKYRPERRDSPYPPTSKSLTRITELRVGMEIWVQDKWRTWYRGQVLGIDGLRALVHTHGWDSVTDELVPIPRIRVAANAEQPAASDGRNPFEESLPPRNRTWTDTTGKFTIKAEFVKLSAGKVTLKRDDGSEISLPLEMLAAADQQIARQLGGM